MYTIYTSHRTCVVCCNERAARRCFYFCLFLFSSFFLLPSPSAHLPLLPTSLALRPHSTRLCASLWAGTGESIGHAWAEGVCSVLHHHHTSARLPFVGASTESPRGLKAVRQLCQATATRCQGIRGFAADHSLPPPCLFLLLSIAGLVSCFCLPPSLLPPFPPLEDSSDSSFSSLVVG